MDGMCALDVLNFGKNYEKVRLKTLSKEINSLSFIFFSCASLENSYSPIAFFMLARDRLFE